MPPRSAPDRASAPRGAKSLVRLGRTVDEMVRTLSDRIVTGALLPGERLDEQSLAAGFLVSRTPVREALGQLAAIGLVERRPNRGAIVAVIAPDRLAAMFDAMAEMEGVCARLSASRMTAAEREELAAEHRASKELVRAGREDDYDRHNAVFHSRLYRGSHNDFLADLASQTRVRLAPFRRAQFRLDGRLRKSWHEHERIVEAILAGEGERAGAAAKAHVAEVSQVSAVFATPKLTP
ncbi:MAG: GntR family transcriptional regulator [Hyphomicrobiales bacterium]|nr:GntR family transcriptional regulator [Hyphomicrobiales bacterium]MDE2017264.1 GntR family transcriptional regulator [Hyphomicrobiales bacterium]